MVVLFVDTNTAPPACRYDSTLLEKAGDDTSLLHSIGEASNSKQLISILACAVSVFDHHDTKAHDDEIDAGAAVILCQALNCALSSSYNSQEVVLLLDLINKLLRCSDAKAKLLFQATGTALLQLLFLVMEMSYRLGEQGIMHLAETIIVQRWASLEMDLAPMKKYEDLLRFLVGAINGTTGRIAVHAATVSLEHLSRAILNKALMVRTPGVLDCLVGVAAHYLYVNTRTEAAKALVNLAWDAANKGTMVKHRYCLGVLIDLTDEAKVSSVEAINFLAMAAENKIIIARYSDGAVLDRLLELTKDTENTSAVATRALSNLVCRKTANYMGNYQGLLSTLKLLASNDLRSETVAVLAAMALKKLATHITRKSHCHGKLLKAIVTVAASSTSTQVSIWIAKAVLEQVTVAESRAKLTDYKGFICAILALAQKDHSSIQTYALESFSVLVSDNRCAPKVSDNIEVVDMLVERASCEDGSQVAAVRRFAVRAILSLAANSEISKGIARHQGLIASLSMYGSSDDEDGKLKRAATRGVMTLAPLLL